MRYAGVQVPFDGMWIDMNEASNFCEGEVCHLPTTQGRTKRHMLQTSADRAPGRPGVQTALARLRQGALTCRTLLCRAYMHPNCWKCQQARQCADCEVQLAPVQLTAT